MKIKLIVLFLIIIAVFAAALLYGLVNLQKKAVLSEQEARQIAKDLCTKEGEEIAAGTYNEITKSWWFDANLNSVPQGCNPACVVYEGSKTAQINWRCSGLILPSDETFCGPEQRNANLCIELYSPVCAKVNVQCIKAPCNPIYETFPNSCFACKNPLVESYIDGECKSY